MAFFQLLKFWGLCYSIDTSAVLLGKTTSGMMGVCSKCSLSFFGGQFYSFGIIRILLHHPRRRTLLLSLKLKNIHLICLSSQKERKRKHFVSQLGTEQASPFASTRLCLMSAGKETTAAFSSCYPQHSLVLVFCLKGAILPSHGEQVAVQSFSSSGQVDSHV